ncbi:MAG: glycosyl transferase [Desulfuromonas sp.]|nr:MAG: glycosyl transferase [Desulfuromonas sp.]
MTMELTVIVPILNEVDQLPRLMQTLTAQRGVEFELILVDGGSNDGTVDMIVSLRQEVPFPIQLISSERGRGLQLNAGAEKARGDTLLFLHADSLFPDQLALRQALECLAQAITTAGHDRIAGHFRLRFDHRSSDHDFGYYFWEGKARLDRPECTHGDQGFLLRKRFFNQAGHFREDLPIAEDTEFAERIRATGRWLMLSGLIMTSARRFEQEGLVERQILNALLMNFKAIDWSDFFNAARNVYQPHTAVGRLDLGQYLDLIDRLNREDGWVHALRRWYRTGYYVRSNAWQLAYLKDVKKGFKRNIAVDDIPLDALSCHDRWFDRLTDNPPGRFIAMVGTWLWFRKTKRTYCVQHKR